MSSFVRHAAIVSGATLLSRLLGFVRDAAMAWLLGAGPAADALSAALRLPWAVRRLLGEGALSLSLTSACAGQPNPCALALAVAKRLVPYLLAVTVLLVLMAPWLADALAPGVSEPMRSHIAALLRLCLPYMTIAVITACAMAGLHASRRFVATGVMPVLFNVVVIGFVLTAFPLRHDPQAAAMLVALGVLVGGLVQWLPGLAAVRLARTGPHSDSTAPAPAPVDSASVSLALRRLPAGLLGAGMAQAAFLLAGIMASWLPPGHMAALFYAERLLEFPMGVLGAALSMAAVPELQRNRALMGPLLEWTLTLHVAAAAGLMAVAEPLAAAVLGHGAFDGVAVRQTASALQAYAWGLPAYALSRPLLALAHTSHQSRHLFSSLWGLSVCGCVGGLLTTGLIPTLTGIGPAVGVSAGLWTQTICLFLFQKHETTPMGLYAEGVVLLRVAWGIVAGAAAYVAANAVLETLSEASGAPTFETFFAPPWLRLLLAVPAGIVAWGLVLYALPACRKFYRFKRAA